MLLNYGLYAAAIGGCCRFGLGLGAREELLACRHWAHRRDAARTARAIGTLFMMAGSGALGA